METISQILRRNGSDKVTAHSYGLIYDSLLGSFDRNAPLDILESGIEYGGSLCAWKEYYPNARVTGVDIVDVRKMKRDDVEFVVSDIKQYQPDRPFDIIIEDGNHSNEDAIWAVENLSRILKPGGVLVVEDVQEGFTVPFVSWGKLDGPFILSAIDLRRLTHRHDDFMITVHRVR